MRTVQALRSFPRRVGVLVEVEEEVLRLAHLLGVAAHDELAPATQCAASELER